MVVRDAVIRQSRRSDWRSIRLLFNRYFPDELPLSRLDAELWDLYPNVLVAEFRGRVVGAAWVRHGWTWGICWLDFIAVEEEYRRLGLGRRLLRAIELLALRAGERRIGLSVLRDNVAALRLYEEMGFKIITSNDRSHSLHRVIEIPSDPPLEERPKPKRGFLVRCVDRALYFAVTLRG